MIPILLDNTKSLTSLVASKTGGIGDIAGAFDGVATEEANGLKEISFKLPIDSPRYRQIQVGSYIKAKVDEFHEPQIYEVYKITKPLRGIVTVRAQHISYILGKATVMPFTATGITMTAQSMISNLIGTFPFTFTSDIVNSSSTFKLDIPMSFRKAIGGWNGSILDTFGGELDWDNLDVHLYAHRGADRGVRIEYGKNMTDLTQEESNEKVYDAVLGYAVVDDTTYTGDVQKIVQTNSPRVLNIDFSSSFAYEEVPTKAKLNQLALTYATNNNIGTPKVNVRVSFEPLSKFEEYKDISILENTGLFDTVYIGFPKLGVNAKAKVIRTEYDFINEKPISVELGSARTNLTNLIDGQIENQISDLDIEVDTSEIEEAVGMLDKYISEFSNIVTNSLGLFFTKVERSGGSVQYYLHNKPLLANSQYQWTINQGGFALSTDYGQTWSAGIDPNGNAIFNSMSANIVRALQIYGSYIQGSQIVFGDPSISGSKYINAQPYYDSNDVSLGVSFDGNGYVRFRPHEEFYVENRNSSDVMLNYLKMTGSTSSSNPSIELRNYSAATGYIGNRLRMATTASVGTITLANRANDVTQNQLYMYGSTTSDVNRTYLANYKKGTTNLGNQLDFRSGSASDYLYLQNYKYNSNVVSNEMRLQSDANNNSVYLNNRSFSSTSVLANQILMTSTSSSNQISISNNTTTGSTLNKIVLQSDGMIQINAASDLRVDSGGAVRLTSSGGQDITLTAADDLNITWGDKLYLKGQLCGFRSDGSIGLLE